MLWVQGRTPSPSVFKIDLSSDPVAGAVDVGEKVGTVNQDVAIKVNLGSIKPLLTLRGTFRSEAGKTRNLKTHNVN